MATIDFPSGAVSGQHYQFGVRIWVYDGAGWEQLLNQGQTVSVLVSVGPLVDLTVTTFPFPVGDNTFKLLTYV